MTHLASIELPHFGEADVRPEIPAATYAHRYDLMMARAAAAGYDAVVIYGDREHSANLAWVSGHDPRFEEAIYVAAPGRTPHLLVGNEGWGYAGLAPGHLERVLWQNLSLMGQPREKLTPLAGLLADAGLAKGQRIGLAGWKGLPGADGSSDPDLFETPHYLVETLRGFGRVENAADVFMNPRDGLRAINDVDELAGYEYAACRTSSAIRRLIEGVRPGMTEIEASRLMTFTGDPHSVHLMLSAGPRASAGLSSPGGRKFVEGDPVMAAYGLIGALTARAGFLVRDAKGLPSGIGDYLERLAIPYFEAAVAWYETIGIGVAGGEVYDAVMRRLGDPFFGVGLNPGHLIHREEWLHSPVTAGSRIPFQSGMAVQCDIIPATGGPYFTINIEDGIALADAALRREFARAYPEAWARIEARRRFMIGTLGIRLKPEILPLSNTPAWLPPFWLSPEMVLVSR
jgi:hypothetical protein